MRIVMLTNAVAPDKLGGLERYVREQATALRALGHDVAVVAKRVSGDEPLRERDDIGVVTARYRVPSKRNPLFAVLYPVVVGLDVARLLRSAGAGRRGEVVVNVHHPMPAIVPMLLGVPYVYTFHAPVWREVLPERHDSYFLPAGRAGVALFRRLEGLLLRRARLVVTLSRFVRDEALALGVDPARHRLVPGGLDTERFTPAPRPSDAEGPGPVLFTARRLVDRTGVDQLVEAMPAVLAALPDARLRVAGAGARRDRVAALIERLGVGHAITLLGRIPDDDLLAEYRAADLAVTPTQELEGFGLSTAEALAVGTPAVVTPVGANPEVVEGLGEGLVAADRTPAAIAAAVVALATDAEALARVRAAARDHVHPRLGWPAVARRYEQLYREASDGR